MSNPTPSFRRGAVAVEAASSGQFTPFKKTEYLQIKDGEKALLRFLTDYDSKTDPNSGELVGGWIGLKQHLNIKTVPQPADFTGSNWPSYMGPPCRRDPTFSSMYSDCFICDVMRKSDPLVKAPSHRLWALAVLREEYVDADGVRTIRDQMRKVVNRDADGNETETVEPRIVVVNMGRKNFFDPLTAYAQRFGGTVLDRDYEITRRGEKIETTYLIIPDEPQRVVNSDGSSEVYDLRKDEFMANYLPEAIKVGYARASDSILEKTILDKTTDEFYGRFFDPSWNGTDKPRAAQPAQPTERVAVQSYEQAAPQPVGVGAPSSDALTSMIQQLNER